MRTASLWLVPASLALCAALVIGAMTWLTRATLAVERERAAAEIRADVQERTRLALWRMDSLGTSILLDESTWPEGGSRLPVKQRFTYSPAGALRSPSAGPEADELKNTLGTGRNALEALRGIALVPAPAPETSARPKQAQADEYQSYGSPERLQMKNQLEANWTEQAVRSKAVESTLSNRYQNVAKAPAPAAENRDAAPAEVPPADPDAAGTPAETIAGQPRVGWVDGRLFLARRVSDASNETFFDGAWIDDAALRAMMLGEVKDLLAAASLMPANGQASDGMVLASFPFRLVADAPLPPPFRPREATVLSLAAAWAAAAFALLATTLLVRGVMRLSERRASFVSAVTHELRTPLTTFRLYSDMLERGAVKEEKRGDYLRVLTREADRLSHLVENVLAFSRIERGNARSHVGAAAAGELLERSRERLAARLESARMRLEMDASCAVPVRVDSAAFEHILFNLIDNAAKYAAGGEPPVVTVTAREGPRFVEFTIRDNGPGIPPSEHRRIFRAFHKSAREAAESRPGVGLGLALSRRLAREQGGDLVYQETDRGAGFKLRLPTPR